MLCDSPFNDLPAGREIMIVRRQGPQRMQMIWQQYLRTDYKGMDSANRGNTGSERGADIDIGQKCLSPKRVDREEVRTTSTRAR